MGINGAFNIALYADTAPGSVMTAIKPPLAISIDIIHLQRYRQGSTAASADRIAPEKKPASIPWDNTGVSGHNIVTLPPRAYTVSELREAITTAGGADANPAFVRIIDNYRVWQAQENGTDRDSRSRIHEIRGDREVMSQHGINNAAEVTYLRPINDNWILTDDERIKPPAAGQSLLIYSAENIRNLRPKWPISSSPFPNNCLYHFTDNPKGSLLAIITAPYAPEPPQPTMTISHRSHGGPDAAMG